MYIYVLKLVRNKYYVGRTEHLDFRLDKHFNALGSAWTKLHKPISVFNIVKGDMFDEDKYTIECMSMFGINNVRGGTFCTIKLDTTTIKMLTKMIRGATDKCFYCGKSGHFIKDCYLLKYTRKIAKRICTRCGRNTHTKDQCYAKKHIRGYFIKDEEPTVRTVKIKTVKINTGKVKKFFRKSLKKIKNVLDNM
jgi:hypothetical protein